MLRLIAAALIVLGASGFGFGASAAVGRRIRTLRDFKLALFYLKNEMLFLSPQLPELLLNMRQKVKGPVGKWLSNAGEMLKNEPTANAADILMECLEQTEGLSYSAAARSTLYALCTELGKTDADLQCRAIDLASAALEKELSYLEENRDARTKSYRMLGICAGLALAVILL